TSEKLGSSLSPLRADFTWSNRDELLTATRFSDLAGTTLVGTTTYGWDDASRLTGITNKNASAATLSYHNYALDAAGRVTSESWYYSYNDANRLTNARQTSDGSTTTFSVTFSYDAEDRRVSEDRWKPGTGTVTTRFGYDGSSVWAELNASNNVNVLYLYGPDG